MLSRSSLPIGQEAFDSLGDFGPVMRGSMFLGCVLRYFHMLLFSFFSVDWAKPRNSML